MSKSLKFYYDFISPPSRALWVSLKLGKTPHVACPVALRKNEQLTDEFKQINRFQKVPCIVDDDFHLAESVAIIHYLSDKGQLSTKLYPKELKERSRVDEFFEWQHSTLRASSEAYFRNAYVMPAFGLAPKLTAEQEFKHVKAVTRNLELVERIWLAKDDFLVGKQLTVADLFGACDIDQLKICKYNVDVKQFPKVAKWLSRVREASNPYYDEACQIVYKISVAQEKI